MDVPARCRRRSPVPPRPPPHPRRPARGGRAARGCCRPLVAGNFNDGASLQTWQARRDREKKLGRDGNGIGTPLPVATALLPTPMAGDFGADKATGPVRPSGTKRQTGLPDVIIHRIASQDCPSGMGEPGQGRLLPTPTLAARRTATAGGEAGPATGTRAGTDWTSRPRP